MGRRHGAENRKAQNTVRNRTEGMPVGRKIGQKAKNKARNRSRGHREGAENGPRGKDLWHKNRSSRRKEEAGSEHRGKE